MVRMDVIYFQTEGSAKRGVFDSPTIIQRMVYAEVRSIGMNEFYRAKEAGISPSVAFVLADAAEYQGERRLIWGSRTYEIVRTYVDGIKIELYAEEAKNGG